MGTVQVQMWRIVATVNWINGPFINVCSLEEKKADIFSRSALFTAGIIGQKEDDQKRYGPRTTIVFFHIMYTKYSHAFAFLMT